MMDRENCSRPALEPGEELDRLAAAVVQAAFTVHSELGPGLLENVYQVCLAIELRAMGLQVERQLALPVIYKGIKIDAGLRLDMVVENSLIVEIKAVESLLPVHKAQIVTYLKLRKCALGLLINFNVSLIKDGLKRVVYSGARRKRLGNLNEDDAI